MELEGLEKYLDEANLDSLGADENTEETSAEASDQLETESGEGESATQEGENLSLEDQLNNLEAESAENGSLLDLVNNLGMLRQGMPVQLESEDQVKELIQKGYDYTAKTQEHSDTVKAFETQMQEQKDAFEAEKKAFEDERNGFDEQLQENQIFGQVLADLQVNDPETLADLQRMYQSKAQMFNIANPAVDNLRKELNDVKGQLQGNQKAEQVEQHKQINAEWENGLKEVQTAFGVKLGQLGVKPDWKSVQDAWAADTTGKLSVKEAFFAKYGEQIQKALSAKAKLAQTRAESAKRKPVTIEDEEAATSVPTSRDRYGADTQRSLLEKYAG